jgi:hypothetical protein
MSLSLIFLIPVGLFVGLISALFGVGGGVIAVPSLVFLYPEVPQTSIIAVSMGMIFLNSLINTTNFYKQGLRSPLKPLIGLSIGMITGVIIGGLLAADIDNHTLRLGFGILLILLGIRSLIIKKGSVTRGKTPDTLSPLLLFPLGVAGGILSGLTGLGGGALLVPLLIFVAKIDSKYLSFISNIGMGSGTLVGVLMAIFSKTPLNTEWGQSFLPMGNFYALPVIILSIGALFSSKYAIRLGMRLDQSLRQKLFAALLLVLGILITWKTALKFS